VRTDLRVVVFADRPLIMAALTALLDLRPEIAEVGAASDDRALTGHLRPDGRPRIVLAALREGGPEAIRMLTLAHRGIPVVVLLSEPAGAHSVRATVAAGADGVLGAAATPDDLGAALQAVADGQRYIHPALGALLAQDDGADPVEQLSPREREVLRLIGLGMTTPEIAGVLVVSPRTVETHRAHLARKLHAQSRADLVRHALRGGLISGGD